MNNPVNRVNRVKNKDIATFDYDALGHRVRKIDAVAGQTTLYYNDPEWRVLAEYAPTNNQQLRKYVYGNYIDEALALVIPAQAGIQTYYFLHDHLYSPAVMIGYVYENQQWQWLPVERYEYDAYGTARIMDRNFGSRSATQYGVTTLFTGRTLDALDSGALKVMYYRHRYTDPFTGRFLQQDPMGYAEGMNLFEYARSDPSNKADPDGLRIVRIYWIVDTSDIIPPYLNYQIPSNQLIESLLNKIVWEPCFKNLKCDKVILKVRYYTEGDDGFLGWHYYTDGPDEGKPSRYYFGIFYNSHGNSQCSKKKPLALTGPNIIADIFLWHIHNRLFELSNGDEEDKEKFKNYQNNMGQVFANIFAHEGLWIGALGKKDNRLKPPPERSLGSFETDDIPLKLLPTDCDKLKAKFKVQ